MHAWGALLSDYTQVKVQLRGLNKIQWCLAKKILPSMGAHLWNENLNQCSAGGTKYRGTVFRIQINSEMAAFPVVKEIHNLAQTFQFTDSFLPSHINCVWKLG